MFLEAAAEKTVLTKGQFRTEAFDLNQKEDLVPLS